MIYQQNFWQWLNEYPYDTPSVFSLKSTPTRQIYWRYKKYGEDSNCSVEFIRHIRGGE